MRSNVDEGGRGSREAGGGPGPDNLSDSSSRPGEGPPGAPLRLRDPWLFIAGPMSTSGEVGANLARAGEAALIAMRRGWIPVVPHVAWILDALEPAVGVPEWKRWSLSLLTRCDAVLRLEGESEGSDREVDLARELGLRVFSGFESVPWVRPEDRIEGPSPAPHVPLEDEFLRTPEEILEYTGEAPTGPWEVMGVEGPGGFEPTGLRGPGGPILSCSSGVDPHNRALRALNFAARARVDLEKLATGVARMRDALLEADALSGLPREEGGR